MSPFDLLSHFTPPPARRRSILDMDPPDPPWLQQLRRLPPKPRLAAGACLIALDAIQCTLASWVAR